VSIFLFYVTLIEDKHFIIKQESKRLDAVKGRKAKQSDGLVQPLACGHCALTLGRLECPGSRAFSKRIFEIQQRLDRFQ
jgi:hypothetical protein